MPTAMRSSTSFTVTIHQGGTQTSCTGPTRATGTTINGADILNIIAAHDFTIRSR
jgi:hypothetical protein